MGEYAYVEFFFMFEDGVSFLFFSFFRAEGCNITVIIIIIYFIVRSHDIGFSFYAHISVRKVTLSV